MSNIAESTAERLQRYSDSIDSSVVHEVAESAEMVHALGATTVALCEAANMDDPKWLRYDGCPPMQILDMPSTGGTDEHETTVLWLAMATGFTDAIRHRMARLKLLLGDNRLIVVANANSWTDAPGALNSDQRARVRTGDMWPLLDPVFRYLEENSVARVNWAGVSFGAKMAAAAGAAAAARGSHIVNRIVAIEPPDIIPRSFPDLALTFLSTRHGLEHHKSKLTDDAFVEALKREPGLLQYIGSLACPTNLAVAQAITHDSFASDIQAVLETSPDTSVTVAWGTASELACHESMKQACEHLEASHGGRIKPIVLEGLKHALCYDIDLVNTLLVQGLRTTVGTGEAPLALSA